MLPAIQMTFLKEVKCHWLSSRKTGRVRRKHVSPLRRNKIKYGPAPKSFLSVRQGAERRQVGCRGRIWGSSCVRHTWVRHSPSTSQAGDVITASLSWGKHCPALPSPAQSDVLWYLRKHCWEKMFYVAQIVFNAFNFMQGVWLLLA